MWRDIKKLLHQHQNFLLTTHLNPDGDGMGSAAALTELLLAMGKQVKFVCDSPLPSKFHFLDFHHTHETYSPSSDYSEVEVVILLDTHRKDRVGRIASIIERSNVVTICIDHHVPSEIFTPHLAIDENACSVGAMVYTLYKECGFDLGLNAAMGVYASVICDTGRFSYSSTNRKAHKIADECIKLGVDPDLMHSRLFQHVSIAHIRMFANTLQHMETHLNNKVVVQQIFCDDYAKMAADIPDIEHEDLEYILDFNKQIEDVECIVLLRELPNHHVRVSLRSTTDLDIGSVMRSLGGGGHKNAAGLSWKGSIQEVKLKILEQLKLLLDKRELSCRTLKTYL